MPAGSPAAVPQWEPDLGCGISVPELQKQLGSADLTLVDLRQKEAFEAWHINGALNLSFAELHNKPYWRNKQVVLMGNGKAERESYSECRHLKQLGYTKVKVLRGGMPAWLAQQGAVLGRVNETVPHMLRLSAAEFWLEAQNLDHLLLLSPAQKALQQELPLSTTLEQETPAAMLTLLARHRKETGAAALSGVVLVAAPDVTDEQIMRLQQAIAPMPLLVYADTREAVQRQIALQKQIWLAQARGPRQLGCGL